MSVPLPATGEILRWFDSTHLSAELQGIVQLFSDLAWTIATTGTGAEVTVAVRKLLEAKDAAVRSVIAAGEQP